MGMTRQSPLATLIELATTATDQAAQRLGQSIARASDAEKKLALLVQYRDEYGQRLNQTLAAGLSAAGYQNFRNFIETLDQAIISQQQVLEQARDTVAFHRAAWQDSERKRLSFGTLAARAEMAAGKQESRREQKRTDEHAARALQARRQ